MASRIQIETILSLPVSGTLKSSETALFPRSYSIASSLATTTCIAEERTARERTALSRFPSIRKADAVALAKEKFKDRRSASAKASSAAAAASRPSATFAEPKSIQCRQCGYVTTVPLGGLNRLPSNYVIKRRVKEALHRLGGDLHTTVWCALCSNETVAIACCLICNQNLCTFCKEAHGRQRSTSQHDVRYLNDLRANYQQQEQENAAAVVGGWSTATGLGRRTASNRTPKCVIHPTHDLKLFCVQCSQVACSNCTVLLHRNHRCEPIFKAAKVYVKMLHTALDRTRPITDYATEAIAKLVSNTKRVNRRADAVQSEVDHFLGEYLAALDVHRSTLLKQIGRAREAKLQTIREQQADLVRRSADAGAAIQFAEELLQPDSTDAEILAFVDVLMRRFEQCQRSRAFLDPQLSDSLSFRPEIRAPETTEQHNIPLFGIITTQTAVPRLCTVAADGLQQLRVHRKVEVVMQSRDLDDKPLCHGGLEVEVMVKYRDATQRQLAVHVADRRDGTYVLAFVPDAAGAMVMAVQLQGKPVKGSPFAMCARTLRPHSGIFHCCTFCSSRAAKGATACACGSQMPGYKGCGHGHDGHPGRRHWSCCASDLETSECSATNAFR